MQITQTDDSSTSIDDTLTEMDMELAEVNRMMTDITDDSNATLPPISNDLYNFIENRLLTLDPEMTMALGKLTYRSDFHLHYFPPDKEGNFGKTLYKKSPPNKISEDGTAGDELGLVFFGEICPSVYGTAITAKGNHYVGTAKYPKPITDTSIVKDILVLRPLTTAPDDSVVNLAFANQCAGLEEILIEDANDRSFHPLSDTVEVTEFLVTSRPEEKGHDRSYIKITLPQKYKVPTRDNVKTADNTLPKKPTYKKTDLLNLAKQKQKIPDTSTSSQSDSLNIVGTLGLEDTNTIKPGTLYDPSLLPDHEGDLFQHENAKLVQPDIRDTNNELVAPWHMREKLRPGTIVVVDSTLVCWHILSKGSHRARNVYQVQGHRVQILHESSGPIEEIKIPTLPKQMETRNLTFDTSPRKTASTAFNSFGSPSKRPRRT